MDMLHVFVKYVFDHMGFGKPPARATDFWCKEIGHVLSSLLERSSYSVKMRRQYAFFCDAYIAPLLGPRPSEYKGIRPTSYMGDDGSPIEYSWVIESEDKMAVRFTVEPLSVVDGSPSPPETWISSLRGLGRFTSSPDFDISWSQTCFDSLGCIPPSNSNLMQQTNCRFFLGANFTSDGILGKSYFLPNFPSRDMEISNRQLVTVCMNRLGLENPWRMVLSYIAQLPAHHQATLPIVSVDCIIPSKNRAKVYIRTQASSLRAIIDLMTLGGELSSPSILSTIATLRHLWRLLFDGIDEDIPLPSRAPDHYATGFLFYFEMSLRDPSPAPKVYIPVRFYCQNDRKIAEALVQYYKDFGISSVGDSYMSDVQSLFPHRDLCARTGIHSYVGCAARETGSQVMIYYSPETFAAERNARKHS